MVCIFFRLDPASINDNTVYLVDSRGIACGPDPAPHVPATLSYNAKKKVTLDPSQRLRGVQHAIVVEGTDNSSGVAVRDAEGEARAQSYVARFIVR